MPWAHKLEGGDVNTESKTCRNSICKSVAAPVVGNRVQLVSNANLRELRRARTFLGDQFNGAVSLADAAELVHLSRWHFLREFRRAFGETPHEFVTRLRIDHARELLVTTDLSVTEVCLTVGFSSLGSFSTLFTRYVGLSPAKYRRRMQSAVTVPGCWPWLDIPFCFARGDSPSIVLSTE